MDTRKIKIAKLIFNLVLALGIATTATSALAVASTSPYSTDANTVLLDHFDGATSASVLAYSETGAACGSAKPSATPNSAYVTGPGGLSQALSLNPPAGQPAGSATYLQYTGGQLLSQANGTIEFWAYLTSYGTGVSLVDQGPFYGSCAGWTFGMSVNATGQLQAGAWAAFTMNSGTNTVPLNTWTHVAASWGSSGAKLYINGVQVGSDVNTGMPASGYGGSVLVNSGAAGHQIDELRISNVQRSPLSWMTKAPMPAARYGAAAGSVNGVLYVAGGADAAGPDSALRAYNPTTDSWSALAPMPGGRYSGDGAAVINGQLYVTGGWTWSPPLPNSNLWAYNPATNAWSTLASMPILSACGSSGAINGKLYVTTGCDGNSGWRNFLHAYDPATNAWSALTSSPDAHASGMGAAINGKFYVVGGISLTGVTNANLDVYDPATNAWSTLAPMPTARQGAATAVLNGKLYVIGGYSAASTYLTTVEAYDPVTNTWITETPMLTARSGATADVVNGVIYVVGGSDATGALAVNEALLFGGAGTGAHTASGTYTWDSTIGVTTTNWTSSDFTCDGPNLGAHTNTGVTITATTMTIASKGGETWTRPSGTANDIVGTWTFTNSTTGNSFTLTFNANGTVSVTGVIVQCSVVADTTPPTVPTGISAVAVGSNQANVSWTASTDNVGVTGYQVYRDSVLVGSPAATSYSDTGLTASTTYSYTVAACDAANNCSAQSTPAASVTTGTTTSAGYAGTYSGTYSGSDTGTWMATVSSSGAVTVTVNSNILGSSIGGSGQVSSNGGLTMTTTGSVSNVATFTGTINSTTGAVTGTWTDAINGSGSFSGAVTPAGVSQFDGTYTGSWSVTCPACGDTAAGTFTATLANGVFTNIMVPITSGTHGPRFDSGTVSSSGAITATGATPAQCSSSVSTFTGQITTGAAMTMTYSRPASGTCAAESGTITATRMTTQAGTVFPIANTSGREMSAGAAFDGTNFLVGIQGDATFHSDTTAQLVSKTGTLVGSRISLGATGVPASGGAPVVAFDGTNYLLAWSCDASVSTCITGQFVSTSGVLIGAPFTIATGTDLGKQRPSIIFDGTNYFVVWQDNSTAGIGDTADVFGQFITPSGAKLGSVLSISTAVHGQRFPAIAFDGTNILAAWADGRNQSACYTDGTGTHCFESDIYGQFITKSGASAAGTLSGSNFLISAGTLPRDNPAGIAFDGTNYLVTFTEEAALPNACPVAGCNWEAYGILVTKAGATTGSRFVLGNTTTGVKMLPMPTYLGAQYLVTWTDGFGTTSASIKGQYVTTSGAASGQEFTLFSPAPSGAVPWLGMVFTGGGVNLVTTNWGIPDPTAPGNMSLYTSADVMGSIITGSGADTQAPTIPTGLAATPASATQINLSWTASTDNVGVTGYQVYRNSVLVGSPAGTGYSDTGLIASTTYSYTVAACDAANNCSAQTAAVSATTLAMADTQAPTVPTGLVATPTSSSQVNLSWTASTDNVGVTSYQVFRNNGQVGWTASTVTSFSDTGGTGGIAASTTYSYTVTACDAAGNCSAPSTVASATTLVIADTQAPTVPTGLAATPTSASQVNLSWIASTDNVGVTGYKVYRNSVLVGSPTGTGYSDTGLTASTLYSYTVAACDAANNCSAQSSAASATTNAGAVALNFVSSWNLVGNSTSAPLTVATTFGDATKVQTVWKWMPATSKWAFYTPTLADGGSVYAAGKGFDFLTTINGGEGFWVNAKVGFTASLPAGTTVTTASFQDQLAPPNPLPAGWSLISVGDSPTPSAFNQNIGVTPPATGTIPTNLVTLWAWSSASASWYFYAPSLDANGTLATYITSKNYLNFGAKVLDPTMGFWVNRPASAGAPSTTAVAISSIQTQLTVFQNLFATAKPVATDPALVALFDASFLDNGMDKTAFLAMLVDPNNGLNVGDQFVGVAAVTPLDTGAVANDATHQWFTFAIQSVGGYVSHDNGGGAWLAIKDAATGNWLNAGNQRHVGISVRASANQQIPSAAQIAMGATTMFSSEVNLDVHTGTGGGGAAALAAAGVTSVLATGPGIVSANGVPVYSSGQNNWVPPCGSQGSAGTITTDCMNVSQATAGAHYTFKIFTTAGGTAAPAYIYTEALYAAPVPVAGLTAANFPAITSVTPTTFASGATVTVNWTLPAGLKSDWLDISGGANVAPYGQLFQTGSSLSGAALTKSLVVPAYTGALGGANIYLRARDVNGMAYATNKQY